MKQIVCLATSPWYPIPTRKQQVMSRMPDAEILYFDPSATIIAPLRDKSAKPLMTAWKQPGEKVRDNITVYRLPPVLPAAFDCYSSSLCRRYSGAEPVSGYCTRTHRDYR